MDIQARFTKFSQNLCSLDELNSGDFTASFDTSSLKEVNRDWGLFLSEAAAPQKYSTFLASASCAANKLSQNCHVNLIHEIKPKLPEITRQLRQLIFKISEALTHRDIVPDNPGNSAALLCIVNTIKPVVESLFEFIDTLATTKKLTDADLQGIVNSLYGYTQTSPTSPAQIQPFLAEIRPFLNLLDPKLAETRCYETFV